MRELSKQIIEHVRRAEETAGRSARGLQPTSGRDADGNAAMTAALAEHAIRIARTAASIHMAQEASRRADEAHETSFESQPLQLAGETQSAREHRS